MPPNLSHAHPIEELETIGLLPIEEVHQACSFEGHDILGPIRSAADGVGRLGHFEFDARHVVSGIGE